MNKKYIYNAILFIVLVIILDIVSGIFLKQLLVTVKSGEIHKTNYVLNQVNTEVLIFGNSRAQHHYIPNLIEKKTGMSCFNCGRDGTGILYNYAIFKQVIVRYKPKVVIFELSDYNSLYEGEKKYNDLSLLNPYYSDFEEIKKVIDLKGFNEKIKHLSKSYELNSTVVQILSGQEKKVKNDNGYVPLQGIYNNMTTENNIKIAIKNIDKNVIKAITDINNISLENKFKLIFVISPYFKIVEKSPIAENYIIKSFKKQNILFIDLSRNDLFINDIKFFKDRTHLNIYGAELFTNIICQEIKSISEKR